MLLQFNFQNFKSFRDEATLDMSATGISEFKHHVVDIGTEKVLPIAAIYGANASGKSNFIEAFEFMLHYVLYSFGFGGDGSGKREGNRAMRTRPFLLDQESVTKESSFEVYFTQKSAGIDRVYNYGFSVLQNEIIEEWLNYKAKATKGAFKRVFYRNKGAIEFEDIGERHQENIRIALEKETLILSLGAKLKVKRLKEVRDWFYKNDIADFGNPRANLFLSTSLPEGFVEDANVQQEVIDFFSTFDPSIVGFNVEEKEESEDRPATVKVDALHKMNDSDELVAIPLASESAGTLKMFALYPMLHDVLASGGVLFVDELNARLHPLLVRAFVIMFLDPAKNPNHAQLVFTTHDTWQLDNDMMRRDEVWLTEKSIDGTSSLYSLAEFTDENGTKIRKDENFEKNYLLGKYGAIPQMRSIDILKGE